MTSHIVHELLRRMGEGPERVAELFADQVDWQVNWPEGDHPATPWIRARTTRADVADHFRTLAAHHVPEQNDSSVTRILVDEADAVVLGHIRQTAKESGRPYTSAFALHLTVEDGLITRYHVYEDSLAVARAHGPVF